MRETDIEKALVCHIKKLGGMCLKLSPLGLAGIPDRLILLPGSRIFFVELKSTGKQPRKLQLIRHKRLMRLGFRVLVIDSKEEAERLYEILSAQIPGIRDEFPL